MEKYAKKQKVSELKDTDKVDDIFFVKFKKGFLPYSKGFSFELTLSDNSGRNIEYKYWGGSDEPRIKALYDSIRPDSIVHVQGKVTMYKDHLQLATNEPFVIEVLGKEQYNDSDFVRPAKKDPSKMYLELLGAIETLENAQIKELLIKIFKDKVIEEKFKSHPGAIEIHHNWIGGLLEHTLEVLGYCMASFEIFPKLDKDLLVAGALLHDIGKLEELDVTSRIKGTNTGQLSGHLVLGIVFVSRKCDEVDLQGEVRDKLMHIIVSHHGKLEFGSPKEPMFPEALAVYYADELSSKIAEMLDFVANARSDTEDDFMYHKRGARNIFLR